MYERILGKIALDGFDAFVAAQDRDNHGNTGDDPITKAIGEAIKKLDAEQAEAEAEDAKPFDFVLTGGKLTAMEKAGEMTEGTEPKVAQFICTIVSRKLANGDLAPEAVEEFVNGKLAEYAKLADSFKKKGTKK